MNTSIFSKEITWLFIISLILFSCNSDEAQSVKIEISNDKINENGGTIETYISANCSWSLYKQIGDKAKDIVDSGEGDKIVNITINRNSDFEERKINLEVISQDKSAQDFCVITQSEAKGLLSNDKKTITLEGKASNFSINVKTNIKDLQIVKPDWIQYKESRALEDNVLNFSVLSNETGTTRKGVIEIHGDNQLLSYTIIQNTLPIYPKAISFVEGDYLVIDTNDNYTLTPTFTPENTTEKEIEWSSNNTDVLTIENGIINVVNNGEAIITAKSKNGEAKATLNITVKIKLTSLKIPYDGNYGFKWWLGKTDIMVIDYEPQNAYTKDLKIISNNPSVCSVSNLTLITSKTNKGIAEITVKDEYSNLQTSTTIEVYPYYSYAGFTLLNSTNNGIMQSYGGTIYSNNKNDMIEVLGATLVDKNDNVIAFSNYRGKISNYVSFTTDLINLTDWFGITSFNPQLVDLRFLVSFKINGTTYIEHIPIKAGTQVKIY